MVQKTNAHTFAKYNLEDLLIGYIDMGKGNKETLSKPED